MDFDTAQAAFLGLALGDAYGRPLEFVTGELVRFQPVVAGEFMWTDDTHMSLYLAEAVLASKSKGFDMDDFGRKVGEAFVAWSHDPLTPSTAPGVTCLEAVAEYQRLRDWRSSGVAHSDGCGAVMRVVPVALGFEGATMTAAAEVSAMVTHGHANGREAAIAAVHLVRAVSEQQPLEQSVAWAIEQLAGPWNRGGTVARSLSAGLHWASSSTADWLDEAAIPEGDGGWRSGSALGLAVAAALRWGDDFRVAIDKSARIDGDSDSVACLCGMLLGARGGLAALPADWLEHLPERERIAAVAKALVL